MITVFRRFVAHRRSRRLRYTNHSSSARDAGVRKPLGGSVEYTTRFAPWKSRCVTRPPVSRARYRTSCASRVTGT